MNKIIDKKTACETYIILNKLELLSKLPEDLKNYLEVNKDKNVDFDIDVNIPLDIQIENENTKRFLSYIFLKYINDSTEEKEYILDLCKQNQIEEDTKARELYNPDNIFKKDNKDEKKEEKSENIEEPKIENVEDKFVLVCMNKATFWERVISFIKNLLK